MKHLIRIPALLILATAALSAQTIVLDNFNSGTASGATKSGTSWVGQVTQNSTTITVGGTAQNDNGWQDTGLALNLSGMNYIYVTAQRDTGHNATANFVVEFIDSSLASQQFSVSTASFLVDSQSQVQIGIGSWTIDATNITDWTIGGGSTPTLAFRMTVDDLIVSASAIPEPSAFAALGGVLALGFVAYRRRALTRS